MESALDITEILLNPEVYDEKVSKIELIKTHISFVFLTGNYVYKVKRPVDFGFLNFTTLENRKFYCHEEIRVNKNLSGEIYLGVVSINIAENGTVKINGPGKAIDYAVKMVQIPQKYMMSTLLKENMVRKQDIEEIAVLTASAHEKAPRGKDVDPFGELSQVRANCVQNFEQTEGLKGTVLEGNEFDTLKGRVMDFMDKNDDLFEKRVKEKRICECHGDLHSGNIFIVREGSGLYKKGIYIFDAIEFFKGFSNSDVAADVAFLAMDLDFNNRKDLSRIFIDRYIKESGDREIMKLLDFYKCYRSYVRSKVTSFLLLDENMKEEEKKKIQDLTRKYFHLALDYSSAL